MILTVHRGTHQIGGTCVEVISRKTRILLDFGMPLADDAGGEIDDRIFSTASVTDLIRKKWLYPIEGLYRGTDHSIDAILITHSHKDHYGYLKFAHPDIPVYMSEGAAKLIQVLNIFLRPGCRLDLPLVQHVYHKKTFEIGDLRITPYLVDHSAFDAMAYHILDTATGESIFYTGDFRASGWKRKLFDRFIAKPPKNVDCLLMEGTIIARETGKYPTEEDVLTEMIRLLRETDKKVVFACCSGQNIDRIVTFCKATRRTKSLFVLDPYTAAVLASIKTDGRRIPQMNWKGVRVLIANYFGKGDIYVKKISESRYCPLLRPLSKAKLKLMDFASLKGKSLVLMRSTMIPVVEKIPGIQGAKLVYSQWSGYFDKEKENGPMKSFIRRHGLKLVHVHTSGHATMDRLKQMGDALRPKVTIPIHTEFPKKYSTLLGREVVCLRDGEPFGHLNGPAEKVRQA